MKQCLLLVISLMLATLMTACGTTQVSGIEPGKTVSYTFTLREPYATGKVRVTFGDMVKWCYEKGQACDGAEFVQPSFTPYMLFIKDKLTLEPRDASVGVYHHGKVGMAYTWNVKKEDRAVGFCTVLLEKAEPERQYREQCIIGGIPFDVRTVLGKGELLWMSGSHGGAGGGRRSFELHSTARYSL